MTGYFLFIARFKGILPEIRKQRLATSLSDNFTPSIRVEDPMLSIVATRLSARNLSGERFRKAVHFPLNSSISEIKLRTSCIDLKSASNCLMESLIPDTIPGYT
jgi:hypothetical protein